MTNMKRSLSDSDSDGESYDDLKVGSPSQSCGAPSDRKKRRGVIEKRRRDRINNSLAELRRLVPTAYEKQGSAKLEKAEILQMTVDHLKVLHSKGLNGYNFDPAALAMDYRSVGFRECAAEVARYLVTAEGMDIQDPLRLRLMSHLQCYCAQREAATKATLQTPLQSSSWSVPSHGLSSGLSSQYPPSGVGTVGSVGGVGGVGSMPHPSAMISQHGPNHPDQLSSLSSHPQPSLPPPVSCHEPARLPTAMDSSNHMRLSHVSHVSTASSQLPPSSTTSAQMAPSVLHSQLPGVHSQFFSMNSVTPMLSPGAHNYATQAPGLGQSSMKPYRPWGAELVY